jgi:hypothetical protein
MNDIKKIIFTKLLINYIRLIVLKKELILEIIIFIYFNLVNAILIENSIFES